MEMDYPQWVLNAAFSIVMGLLGLISAIIVYIVNIYRHKIDAMEHDRTLLATAADLEAVDKASREFATNDHLREIEMRIATLVSRRELLTYLKEMRESNQQKHAENIEHMKEIRVDIRNLHLRIDEKL